MSTTTWLVPPTDDDCLTPQKSDPPRAPCCSPRYLPTFHPFIGRASGRWGGTDEEAGVKYWHCNRYGDRAVRLLLSFHTSNATLPSKICCSACVCCYLSPHLRLFSVFYFAFWPYTQITQTWCMHSWSWQSRPGSMWFTDPLLTYWFDLPFTFQRPGILTAQGLLRSDSACLTTVENRSEYAASWLTDMVNGCDTSCTKLGQKSRFLTTFALDLHLLTPFVAKNFASLVLVKYYSTLQFYWNNNILAVMLQAERKDSYASLQVTPLVLERCDIVWSPLHTRSKRQGFHVSNQWAVTLGAEWNHL